MPTENEAEAAEIEPVLEAELLHRIKANADEAVANRKLLFGDMLLQMIYHQFKRNMIALDMRSGRRASTGSNHRDTRRGRKKAKRRRGRLTKDPHR